jgi:hypothetical protein
VTEVLLAYTHATSVARGPAAAVDPPLAPRMRLQRLREPLGDLLALVDEPPLGGPAYLSGPPSSGRGRSPSAA